jgi:RHS repeat-associated protein
MAETNAVDVPESEKRSFEYDAAGRLIATILPEVNDPCNGYQPAHPRYDYFYDDYGNMAGILDPLAHLTVFEYDEHGRQTTKYMPFAFVDPTGGEITIEDIYNACYTASPDVETSVYDEFGRIESRTDYKGQVTGYIYNNRGQLWHKKYYNSSADYPDNPAETITYTYDSLGRKYIDYKNSQKVEEYSYDAEGQIEAIYIPQGWIKYEYYSVTGQRKSTLSFDSSTTFGNLTEANADTIIDYSYDDLGRLKTVKSNKLNGITAAGLTAYTYNDVGSLQSVEYANGNYAEYQYDALDRLTNLTNYRDKTKTNTLSSFEYRLAADGIRRYCVGNLLYEGSPEEDTFEWTYDNLNRLVGEKSYADNPENPGQVWYDDLYEYDLAGNRTKKTVNGNTVTNYFYTDNDQLDYTTGAEVIDYDYDLNGSLIRQTSGGIDTIYTYSLLNRLESVTSGSITTNYQYNTDGIRVQKKVGSSNPIDYLVDPYNHTDYSQVFSEVNDTSRTDYVIGLDVLSEAADYDDPTDMQYLLYDGQDSVRQISGSDGAVIYGQTHYYDAYGNFFDTWSSEPQSNLRYTGEQWDDQSRMYYLRARYYGPRTGRFNQRDQFSGFTYEPQSLHKYLYCYGNPINATDSLGLFTQAFGYVAEDAIQLVYALDHSGNSVAYGRWTRLLGAYRLKPDILNITKRRWLEIKPLSISGATEGALSFAKYSAVLGFLGYKPDIDWIPSTHFVTAGAVEIFFFNAGGIVFYTDAFDNAEDLIVLGSIAAVKEFLRSPAGQRIAVSAVGMLSRIPVLVKARIGIDRFRLEGHLSIGEILASFGVI